MKEEDIERLRGVVRDCVNKHLYSSAIFFADKVAAFTGDPADIYMQAQALFLGRHFRRALHLLTSCKIIFRDLRFRYLAAKCLEELKEWHQCLEMLGDAKVDEHGNVKTSGDCNVAYLDKDGEDREINISSAMFFLRGKAYEALENRAQALLWYKAAIKADPYCYEALECLVDNHMLTHDEEKVLLSTLQFAPGDGWLSAFYSCLTKKYEKENVVEEKFAELEREHYDSCSMDVSFAHTLKDNTDLLTCKADYYHQCGDYQKCFDMTTIALSWFAVGCYYYCIKKFDQSRRYFWYVTLI
ncbi:Anaphase-promoting complex subunit 6 [Nymphaea thermarum]|nr:Anaphase-promoting complex subunit 6 [Nymphaea thermarum]